MDLTYTRICEPTFSQVAVPQRPAAASTGRAKVMAVAGHCQFAGTRHPNWVI
jgi:hypothetical protein